MATPREILNSNVWFTTNQKGVLVKCFNAVGSISPEAAPDALVDGTGGTANNSVQAVAQVTPGEPASGDVLGTDLNAILTVVNNNFADLTIKINQLRTALISAGVLTA